MVDYFKFIFCSGMLLIFLSVGCAGTGAQLGSVAGFGHQVDTMPSGKRMIAIAKTYEEIGYEQRAIATYRQVIKRYSKTKQGEFARGRIMALKGPAGQDGALDGSEKTMLASLPSKPDALVNAGPPVLGSKQIKKEVLEESTIIELPPPEQLADATENKVASLIVNSDIQERTC